MFQYLYLLSLRTQLLENINSVASTTARFGLFLPPSGSVCNKTHGEEHRDASLLFAVVCGTENNYGHGLINTK